MSLAHTEDTTPGLIPIKVRRDHKDGKLYHITQLHSYGSNSRPLVKIGETSTILPRCLVVDATYFVRSLINISIDFLT